MLKLTLRPGEFIDIGKDIRVVFSGGSANNIHLLVEAPREINIARSSAGGGSTPSPYFKEQGISETARQEIREILRREKSGAARQTAEKRAESRDAAEKKAAGAEMAGKKAAGAELAGKKGSIYMVRHK